MLPFISNAWWRSLDDIFMIWTEGLDHLKIFVDYLDDIHPTIKSTSNYSLTNVPFLDVMLSLHNGTLETDVYNKTYWQTCTSILLISSSCHPQHAKKTIPFSLVLRIRRVCSSDANFTLHLNELTTLARGHDDTSLDLQFKRAASISRTDALILTVTIQLTTCLLLLHISRHFLAFLIPYVWFYVDVFTYYFPPTAAGKFLNTPDQMSPTDTLLTFETF